MHREIEGYMRPRSTRATVTTIVSSVVFATACGDSRLEKLSTGINRDSALAIINDGASGDSLARVYRQETYLLPNKRGNSHLANILFYNRSGVKEADDSTLSREAMTPVVLLNGSVAGWGWTFYDSLAKANNIPVK